MAAGLVGRDSVEPGWKRRQLSGSTESRPTAPFDRSPDGRRLTQTPYNGQRIYRPAVDGRAQHEQEVEHEHE